MRLLRLLIVPVFALALLAAANVLTGSVPSANAAACTFYPYSYYPSCR